MRMLRLATVGGVTVAVAASLTACSIDTVIWGAEGARVIQATEDLISDLSDEPTSPLLCADSVAELGAPSDWNGLSAGEPERFVDEYWDDQAPLDPEWSINLEGLAENAVAGSTHPGDVFYRETERGLCVVDIAWATLVG